jgi:hypothetical protein
LFVLANSLTYMRRWQCRPNTWSLSTKGRPSLGAEPLAQSSPLTGEGVFGYASNLQMQTIARQILSDARST